MWRWLDNMPLDVAWMLVRLHGLNEKRKTELEGKTKEEVEAEAERRHAEASRNVQLRAHQEKEEAVNKMKHQVQSVYQELKETNEALNVLVAVAEQKEELLQGFKVPSVATPRVLHYVR